MVFIDTITYHLYGDIFFLAPVFIPSKNSPDLLNYYLLAIIHIIEFIAISFSLPVTLLHNYCLTRSIIFHPNLIRIAQVYLSGNYFAVVSRLVMHLYQVGVFHFDDRNSFSKMLLFIASIIRSYFFLSSLIFLAEAIVERTFALYFVVDYEKKPRLWISTGILAITLTATILVTVTMMIRLYSIRIFIFANCIAVVIFLIIFTVVYRQNISRLHELRNGTANAKTKNTLSTKFQLMENVRVMKLVMMAFSVACVLIFSGLILFGLALVVYTDEPGAAQLCLALLDLLVALSTAAGFFAFLLVFDEWRQAIKKCPMAMKLCYGLMVRLDATRQSVDEHRGATDHYFNQLRQAWS